MSYPFIYRGKVLNNEDPKNLGRCKILVPSIHGVSISANLLPWARPISTLPVNETSGSYCIPATNDIVWVFFEGGDSNSPVYLGGSYGTGDIEIKKDVVSLYQNGSNFIHYNRESGSFHIEVGESVLDVSSGEILIRSGTVRVQSSNIILDSNVDITGNLNISGSLNIAGSCNRECKVAHEQS